jgi:peptidoglycan pentaglycine glycine transferase (the first glycine)
MSVRLCTTEQDYRAWDEFVFNSPGAHYWQTYGWLKSYEPMGFTPHVLTYATNGVVSGGVALLSFRIPLVSRRIFIVPHGPIPTPPETESWPLLMQAMDAFCREHGAIYTQLYPHESSEHGALRSRVEQLGFRHPPLFTSHRFSSDAVTVRLQGKSTDDILLSFRPKTRQHLRHALNSELRLGRDVDEATFDKIYELLVENGNLLGYRTRPYVSLRLAWEWFSANDRATFLQAWHDQQLVGAVLLVFTGKTAYYLAGAMRRQFQKVYPAEFLHWQGICEASKRGLDTYDFVGMGTEGVEQFKRGFRPEMQYWHDARTKIYSPRLARTLTFADRRLRKLVRLVGYARAGQWRCRLRVNAAEK